MAKVKRGNTALESFKPKPKVRRPGVHAKTKMSKTKGSKCYRKKSVGQGNRR